MAAPDDAFPPLPRTKLVQRKPETGPVAVKASSAASTESAPAQESLVQADTGEPGTLASTTPELDGLVILALKSQKERNFLLKLESHIINNLQSGTIERIKLTTPMPPKLRKLVHMVSDYFGLHRMVDKEEGEEKKATMTLLKTPQTRIPVRKLSVICTELDDEDRQPFQLQRKVAEASGAAEEGEATQVTEEPKLSWAEIAAKGAWRP
eukprot:symbB.v1.2.017566.t1/scaffold1365.1/size229487/13